MAATEWDQVEVTEWDQVAVVMLVDSEEGLHLGEAAEVAPAGPPLRPHPAAAAAVNQYFLQFSHLTMVDYCLTLDGDYLTG